MTAPDEPRPPRLVREVDLDWRSVLVGLTAIVGLLAIRGLARRVPRTITGLGIAVIGLLVVPPAVRQARDLTSQRTKVVRDLGNLPIVGARVRKADVQAKIDDFLDKLPTRLSGNTTPLTKAAKSVADGILAALVTLLFAITMLLDGPRLLRQLRRAVPVDRRSRADEVARVAYRVVGRYVAGSLLVAGVCGFVVLVAGLAAGVPLSPLAAVWAAFWDLVPQIGGAAGGIPFIVLGLTRGAGTAVICAGVFVVYQQLKHQVIQPVLIGQAVKLSPPATMTAALVGVSAGGVVGALIAVPLVGAAKAVYLEFRRVPT